MKTPPNWVYETDNDRAAEYALDEIDRLTKQRDELREALTPLRDDLKRRHDAKLKGSKNYLGEIVRPSDAEEIERMAKMLIKADYALANLNKTDKPWCPKCGGDGWIDGPGGYRPPDYRPPDRIACPACNKTDPEM